MAVRKNKRLTLRQTVEQNLASISFMTQLAGKPAPVFDDDLLKPKRVRAAAKPSIHPSEAEVLKTILKYLRLRKEVAWVCRINSGTFAEDDRFISSNSQRGMSDIIGMMQGGKLFAIEVKSHNGRLMQHQDDFLCLILSGGGYAGVARSIEDVDKILGWA